MNPAFPGWYADPELHFFEGKYWIYPTCSRIYEEQTTFEAFSSPDLENWTTEGTILDFADVPWSTNRAAWAPSAAFRNGRYYLCFSAGDGAGLGMAVADSPQGPFRDALGRPLVSEYFHGAQPIDAHLFQDRDGTPYLYWGGWRHAVMARMSDDLLGFDSEIVEITPQDYVEGPFMVRMEDDYLFLWSEGSWGDPTYRVAYARSDSPWGPFERRGTLLESDPAIATSAGHCSVLRLPGSKNHILAYHRRPLGRTGRDERVVCMDWLEFDANGDPIPVRMTHEGVRVPGSDGA